MKGKSRIGRNPKCPCGSGKRLKKCGCGRTFHIPNSASDAVADAYHEAAHAVFNVLLDFPLAHVTIVPSTRYVGHCTCLESSELGTCGRMKGWRCLARLVVLLAGPATEWLRGTMPKDRMPFSDSNDISRLISAIPGIFRQTCCEAGMEYVSLGLQQKAIRRAIDRVAEMLVAEGYVEGAVVHSEVMAIAGGYFVSKESTDAEGLRKLRFAQTTVLQTPTSS
jgi:hypothetical protein